MTSGVTPAPNTTSLRYHLSTKDQPTTGRLASRLMLDSRSQGRGFTVANASTGAPHVGHAGRADERTPWRSIGTMNAMTTSVSRSHFFQKPALAMPTTDRSQPAPHPASSTPAATANTLTATATATARSGSVLANADSSKFDSAVTVNKQAILSPPALPPPRQFTPRQPASGPVLTTAMVHPQPQATAAPSIKPYIQAAERIGATKPSVAAIDRGIHVASNGRRYINLAEGTEDAAQVVEVVPTGSGLWQAHRDGAAAGPFFKFDNRNRHWSIVDNVELGPNRSKWGPPPEVDFTPSRTSPVIHRNLNTASARGPWNAADHVDMHAIQKAINTELQIDVKAPTLETISGRDLAKKMNIPYDETNPGANPAAWTSPEGTIYLSRDAPDYVVNGNMDVDKIRSTVIHESIHSASANHTGLQAVTRQKGDVGLSALNYDEAAVDYFAYKVYQHLYPGQPYKSGYFVAQGTLWMGETVRFLETAGVMNIEQLKTALFSNPDLFKRLPEAIKQEWLAWGNAGPRAPTSSAPPGPKMPNAKL